MPRLQAIYWSLSAAVNIIDAFLVFYINTSQCAWLRNFAARLAINLDLNTVDCNRLQRIAIDDVVVLQHVAADQVIKISSSFQPMVLKPSKKHQRVAVITYAGEYKIVHAFL